MSPTEADLSPYVRTCLERATRTADHLHADEVALEHLLLVLLEDEDCGAHRLVLHAFADPETIRAEVLALAPGILVVGSGTSLPFSHGGVRALFAARRIAGDAGVDPALLFAAALGEMDGELVDGLREAGLELELPRDPAPEEAERAGVFRDFDDEAKRALGAACRAAQGFGRDAISPAHLVLGCLERAPGRELAGLRLGAARMRLGGRDADAGRPPARDLPADPDLARFLRDLPAGTGTAGVLHEVCARGAEELRLLLSQQRITVDLTRSSAEAFDDPAAPPPPPSSSPST